VSYGKLQIYPVFRRKPQAINITIKGQCPVTEEESKVCINVVTGYCYLKKSRKYYVNYIVVKVCKYDIYVINIKKYITYGIMTNYI